MLEIAAGTGIVTRLLRDALPPTAQLLASDLNPPMLEVARRKFRNGENVRFEPADATNLPFADAAYDAVACQFGVMFFPDKPRAYREVHRVLAPGGHYLFNVWDSFAYNRYGELTHELLARLFPKDPPGFYKVPLGYHQIDPIKQALIEAGFGAISAHVLRIDKSIPDAAVFAQGLIRGNPVVAQIQALGTVDPAAVVAELTMELRRAFGPDPGRMSLQSILFSARKPG